MDALRSTVLCLALVLSACGAERGEHCYHDDDCAKGLTCSLSQCSTQADIEAWHAKVAAEEEAKKREELLRQQDILRQSGLDPGPLVERPAEPEADRPAAESAPVAPGGPGAVRVVHTIAKGKDIFAACRPGERLLGGGCKLPRDSYTILESRPGEYSPTDTQGARWICKAYAQSWYPDDQVEAYALCQTPAAP
jgi:hypothetical protein